MQPRGLRRSPKLSLQFATGWRPNARGRSTTDRQEDRYLTLRSSILYLHLYGRLLHGELRRQISARDRESTKTCQTKGKKGIMTTTSQPLAHIPSTSNIEHYDPDEVVPKDSPLLTPHQPRLQPSPSPPPVIPLPQVSLSPSPTSKHSNRRPKVQPSQGDAVLVSYLGEGRNPDIAIEAGTVPLPAEESPTSDDSGGEEAPVAGVPPPLSPGGLNAGPPTARERSSMSVDPPPQVSSGPLDLKLFAVHALAFTATRAENDASKTPPIQSEAPTDESALVEQPPVVGQRESAPPKDIGPPRSAGPPSFAPTPDLYSPRQSGASPLRSELGSPTRVILKNHGELPPLQSPQSDANGRGPLPSIRHLADIADKELPHRHSHAYTPSAQPLPRLPSIVNNHASPPISPNETYRRDLPSPNHTLSAASPYFYTSRVRHVEYSSSSNSETPNTDVAGSTPATTVSGTDRMSIDGITNPIVIPSFVCTFPSCTAAPFSTQYLLNSHANVHSSARPHYCPVQGCPRSEGGKGFKRKNEMIRHGLVHDSPGYVCPFCPDREHKYPRPDNLQRHVTIIWPVSWGSPCTPLLNANRSLRHVRVHHVDKDKDDPLLRDVLSQRPDGPNRGRRRRGGPG